MSDDAASEAKTERTVFVGRSDAPWWKFKLAGIVWKLTRGNPIPGVGRLPGVNKAAMWAFQVRVTSRDMEVDDAES